MANSIIFLQICDLKQDPIEIFSIKYIVTFSEQSDWVLKIIKQS